VLPADKVHEALDAVPDDSLDVVYDNYGAPGTADKAMRTLKTSGTYLVVPGGEAGGISKHPKAGVKQITFAGTKSTNHTYLDTLASLFDAGKMVAHVYDSVELSNAAFAFAMSATGNVAGKVSVAVPQGRSGSGAAEGTGGVLRALKSDDGTDDLLRSGRSCGNEGGQSDTVCSVRFLVYLRPMLGLCSA